MARPCVRIRGTSNVVGRHFPGEFEQNVEEFGTDPLNRSEQFSSDRQDAQTLEQLYVPDQAQDLVVNETSVVRDERLLFPESTEVPFHATN